MLSGNELNSLFYKRNSKIISFYLNYEYNKRKEEIDIRLSKRIVFGCILELFVRDWDDFFQNSILIFDWIKEHEIKGLVLNRNFGIFSKESEKWELDLVEKLIQTSNLIYSSV